MNITHRRTLLLGALLAGLAVGIGAFGAHGLEGKLEPDRQRIFETAVKYHFYHSFALLITALLSTIYQDLSDRKKLSAAAWLFGIGVLLFSGSLYLLACKNLLGIESWKWLGLAAPLGGLCFLGGWATIAYLAVKSKPFSKL